MCKINFLLGNSRSRGCKVINDRKVGGGFTFFVSVDFKVTDLRRSDLLPGIVIVRHDWLFSSGILNEADRFKELLGELGCELEGELYVIFTPPEPVSPLGDIGGGLDLSDLPPESPSFFGVLGDP